MFEGASSLMTAARPVDTATLIELAKLRLEELGVEAIPDVLNGLPHPAPEGGNPTPLLIAVSAQLIAAFNADPCSPAAYAAIDGMPRDLAALTFDLMLESAFGGGARDIRLLTQTGLLCLVALLSAAGAHEQAALLLAEARAHGNPPPIANAAWIARCRWAGCATSVDTDWMDAIEGFATLEAAEAGVDAAPLDLAAHRARARFQLRAGNVEKAAEAIAVALALPIGDGDKMDIAGELALLAAMMAVRAELPLRANRLRWALAAAPGVTARAAAMLKQAFAAGRLSFLDETEAAAADAALQALVQPAPARGLPAVTGFPMRSGKPHVDIVWLEITNHCNQKCTFCPDMFREDARTWLPLDQVKQLIDQLADTISVGSMQLNAYGEPLLHPNIAEILAYIRERNLPWPTFFTSHGMTLVDKKLLQLSHNYPTGIAISLHNDSQESYQATRSRKIGDYDTLVSRVTALMRQMTHERAPSHLRLYQMVSNGHVDLRVDEVTRGAFPDSPERMAAHIRKWERIAKEIALSAPPEAQALAHASPDDYVSDAFRLASHGDTNLMPILSWLDTNGRRQEVFMSARPVGTYANLLLEYDPRWAVERKMLSRHTCGFTARPSLAIFATGRLGICCLDLNSTATLGSLSDFADLRDALTSPQALRMFAQLSNGVATSRGCQICLGGTERHCASRQLGGPVRPAGHFPEGI